MCDSVSLNCRRTCDGTISLRSRHESISIYTANTEELSSDAKHPESASWLNKDAPRTRILWPTCGCCHKSQRDVGVGLRSTFTWKSPACSLGSV